MMVLEIPADQVRACKKGRRQIGRGSLFGGCCLLHKTNRWQPAGKRTRRFSQQAKAPVSGVYHHGGNEASGAHPLRRGGNFAAIR